MQGYLRDWRGNIITDKAGHPLPIEWYHDVDEYGRLLPGASQFPPEPFRQIVRR